MRDEDIGPRTARGWNPDISAGRRRGVPTEPDEALGGPGVVPDDADDRPVDRTGVADPGDDADLTPGPPAAPVPRDEERFARPAIDSPDRAGPRGRTAAQRDAVAAAPRRRRTRSPWASALVAVLASAVVIAAIVLFAVTGLVAGLIVLLAGGALATAVALVVGVLRSADIEP